MSVTVRIPTPLRSYADGKKQVEVEAATVREALDTLVERHPDLRPHLYDEEGRLRNFVNAFVNDEDVRERGGGDTPVRQGDTVTLVPSIAGGRDGGHPGVPGTMADQAEAVGLSNEEIHRYSRHLIMPEVGMEGQKKLKAARVLMVGSGGLGSPVGMYLAAAGVGTLGIVDFDEVDETNLQRQLLHGTSDVGRPKLDSARERLEDVNPHVEIRTHEARLTSENALEIFEPYDIVVDGTDNFPTRYLVNDACVLQGKPNVYGSIFRFEGQVSVFDGSRGPCYRCLFREPPPPGLVPSCAEGGVLGVLPGIIGSLQALETIKLILGRGESMLGRLLIFDALEMEFREVRLRKNPECPACGENPTVTELIDYLEFCGVSEYEETDRHEGEKGVPEMAPSELKDRLERGERLRVLDVREPHEWDIANLGDQGAELIPLGELPDRMAELDSSEEMVFYCRSGARSARAVEQLQEAGFRKLWNLGGGILRWQEDVDPSLPRY